MTTNLVFCDFDGTVSRRDIGYNIFRHFSNGKNEELLPDWKSGKMTTRDCLAAEAAMVNASPEEIYSFLERFELNAGFTDFVELLNDLSIPLIILSDGLDFYIKYILEKNNLTDLPVLSNVGRLEDNTIKVEFPHDNHSCKRCGSCKAERIAEFRATFDSPTRAIFVGDGYSDACATREADIILAKKDLEEYCRASNIEYSSYDDFYDVVRILDQKRIFNSKD